MDLMLKQLIAILKYYKVLAFWSFLVTLYITFVCPKVLLAVVTKLFLVVLLWLMISDSKTRRRLRFYRIVGVSDLKFFGIIFLFDSLLTCGFLTVMKDFI